MDYSGYERIRVDRDGSILTLTLNRPDSFNAVDHELHEELGQIFTDIARDPETSVVVLTGAGEKAFSAGGDLKAMERHAREHGAAGHYIDMSTARRIIFSMLDLEKPIIARINGVAVGLGATLALFCDISYLVEGAKIGDPHVLAGVVAGDGGALIWPLLVGPSRAKEFLMTGDLITAERAERIGLVNYAVPREELDSAVYGMARRLADGPQDAIRWSKVSVNVILKQLAAGVIDTSLAYETVTFRGPTHAEAIGAFAEKRPADFRGL